MKTLLDLYNKHKKGDWPDKGSIHSYIEVYEEILAPYRLNPDCNILEIGLMSGESLRMWSEYFTGSVFGMDCDIKPINGMADLTQAIIDGYNIKIGDATNPVHVLLFFSGLMFDVIIEDAGHDVTQQLEIYSVFKPYLNKGGIYIIEDVQDINKDKAFFLNIDDTKSVQIFDRRKVKGRYDDCLIIIKPLVCIL